MKTATFIKRFASVLLVMVLMLQNFAFAQVQGPADFYTKSKKSEKKFKKKLSHNVLLK